MLFVVIFLVMMLKLELLLLDLILSILVLVGVLVLLYHVTSYYSLRGCTSYSGSYCGAFYVSADTDASGIYLAYGAVLS